MFLPLTNLNKLYKLVIFILRSFATSMMYWTLHVYERPLCTVTTTCKRPFCKLYEFWILSFLVKRSAVGYKKFEWTFKQHFYLVGVKWNMHVTCGTNFGQSIVWVFSSVMNTSSHYNCRTAGMVERYLLHTVWSLQQCDVLFVICVGWKGRDERKKKRKRYDQTPLCTLSKVRSNSSLYTVQGMIKLLFVHCPNCETKVVLKRQGSKWSLKKGGPRSRVPSRGNMKGERGLHKKWSWKNRGVSGL